MLSGVSTGFSDSSEGSFLVSGGGESCKPSGVSSTSFSGSFPSCFSSVCWRSESSGVRTGIFFFIALIFLSPFAFSSFSPFTFCPPSKIIHKNPTHRPKLHSCLKLINSQNCSIVLQFRQPCPRATTFPVFSFSSLPSSSRNLAFGSSGKCGITSRTAMSAPGSSLYGCPWIHLT